MFSSVCGGWASCRRIPDRLTVYAWICRNVDRYLECGRCVVSVHTGLLLGMGGGAELRTK